MKTISSDYQEIHLYMDSVVKENEIIHNWRQAHKNVEEKWEVLLWNVLNVEVPK